MAELTFAEISKILKYYPETGKFVWLPRTPEMFADCGSFSGGPEAKAKTWNARYAGAYAFTSMHNRGYIQASILGHSCLAHRAAWVFISGSWPKEQIDHINGDRTDNRADNLRQVSNIENSRNMTLSKANKSGRCGVFWNIGRQRWQAGIKVEGKRINLGVFREFQKAVEAREVAEERYGFHRNHGKTQDLKKAAE